MERKFALVVKSSKKEKKKRRMWRISRWEIFRWIYRDFRSVCLKKEILFDFRAIFFIKFFRAFPIQSKEYRIDLIGQVNLFQLDRSAFAFKRQNRKTDEVIWRATGVLLCILMNASSPRVRASTSRAYPTWIPNRRMRRRSKKKFLAFARRMLAIFNTFRLRLLHVLSFEYYSRQFMHLFAMTGEN